MTETEERRALAEVLFGDGARPIGPYKYDVDRDLYTVQTGIDQTLNIRGELVRKRAQAARGRKP